MTGVPSGLKIGLPSPSTALVPNPASTKASTAAGLVMVWSTIKLEIVRGCESITMPPES
jgi:hypothetical protein